MKVWRWLARLMRRGEWRRTSVLSQEERARQTRSRILDKRQEASSLGQRLDDLRSQMLQMESLGASYMRQGHVQQATALARDLENVEQQRKALTEGLDRLYDELDRLHRLLTALELAPERPAEEVSGEIEAEQAEIARIRQERQLIEEARREASMADRASRDLERGYLQSLQEEGSSKVKDTLKRWSSQEEFGDSHEELER